MFLNKNKLKKFQDIIITEIKKSKELSNLSRYKKQYLFKLINNGFNYDKILKEKYDKGNCKSNEKLYLMKNVVESINSKINFYLPKRITNNSDFIDALSNIFINSKFEKKDIIRHDYLTKSLIQIIIKAK